MTKKEFSQIAMAIKTYYPKETIIPNEQAMALWYNALKDIDYKVMSLALDKWVNGNKWSPAISDLREYCTDIMIADILDWGEAYETVMKAISNFGYSRVEEAYATFDELTAKVVRRLGFKKLCESVNQMADRANFRDLYIELAEKKKKDMQMPETLKTSIAETKQKYISEKKQEMLEAKDV